MTLIRNTALILLSALLCASCATTGIDPPEQRVLFVGNSQLYVGNMPAVFAALASANGHPVASDMIVRGGASLADRVADGSIAAALRARGSLPPLRPASKRPRAWATASGASPTKGWGSMGRA